MCRRLIPFSRLACLRRYEHSAKPLKHQEGRIKHNLSRLMVSFCYLNVSHMKMTSRFVEREKVEERSSYHHDLILSNSSHHIMERQEVPRAGSVSSQLFLKDDELMIDSSHRRLPGRMRSHRGISSRMMLFLSCVNGQVQMVNQLLNFSQCELISR